MLFMQDNTSGGSADRGSQDPALQKPRTSISDLRPSRSNDSSPGILPDAPTAVIGLFRNMGLPEWTALIDRVKYSLIPADTVDQVLQSCMSAPAPIVLTDTDSDCWRELLDKVQRLSSPPCVIVVSDRPEQNILADVLQQGGFDVLNSPVQKHALTHDLRVATERWSRAKLQRESMRKLSFTA